MCIAALLMIAKLEANNMSKIQWLKHNKTLYYSYAKPSSDVPGKVTLLSSSLSKNKCSMQAFCLVALPFCGFRPSLA